MLAKRLAARLPTLTVATGPAFPRVARLVTPETAALVRRVGRGMPIAVALARTPTPAEALDLFRLTLDGVIAAVDDDDAHTGAAAWQVIIGAPPPPASATLLHTLNGRAVDYGAMLLPLAPRRLAARLYRFHALPVTPRWRARLPDRERVHHHLGLDTVNPWRALTLDGWRRTSHGDWITWSRDTRVRQARPHRVHKLFVSPRPEGMTQAVRTVARVVPGSGAVAFKVGATLEAILRPDKIVIYFPTHAALARVAARLARSLRELATHGVPLSGPVDARGLLSWGIDPPAATGAPPWARESWRMRLTRMLALALARGGAASPAAARDYALARLALDGLDLAALTPGRVATALDVE